MSITIKSTYKTTPKAILGVSPEHPFNADNHDVYIRIKNPNGWTPGDGWAVFEPQECFEIIEAIAKEAGLYADENDQVIHVKRPKPRLSKEDARRIELEKEYFAGPWDLTDGDRAIIDHVIKLEKEAGKL